jgi:hypothetical protein
MSRSTRKTPIHGITKARSESSDKQVWHGRLRAAERTRLAHDGEDHIPVHEHEVSDPYGMSKDGKRYVPSAVVEKMARSRVKNSGLVALEASKMRSRVLAKFKAK